MKTPLTLRWYPNPVWTIQLPPDSALPDGLWQTTSDLWSITRTPQEWSLIMPQPLNLPEAKQTGPWRAFAIVEQLDFSLTGILQSIAAPLAQANIPIFVVSTYNTDIILLASQDTHAAHPLLEEAGFIWNNVA